MKVFKRDKRTALKKEIDRITEQMSITNPASEEYAKMAEALEKLMAAQQKDNGSKLSKDSILMAAVSLLQIGMVLNFEKLGFITSKAMQFVNKARVK